MSPEEVNTTLGIKPYNLLHRNDSTSLFVYNYKLKNREVDNIGNFNNYIHREKSQTEGDDWFVSPSKFYVLYEKERLSTLITQNGLENAEYLLLKNNNLFLVSQSDSINLDLIEGGLYLHRLDKSERFRNRKAVNKKVRTPFKNRIMYSLYYPYGYLGLKYTFGKSFGAYLSFGADDEINYITVGAYKNLTPSIGLYLGVGAGPTEQELYGYSYNHITYDSYSFSRGIQVNGLNAFVFEGGVLYDYKFISLDAGIGINESLGLFGKLGLGIKF
ncbi:MAG: hypothetical protein ACEPOV_12280 [Hyphomicrobiales bacterium]